MSGIIKESVFLIVVNNSLSSSKSGTSVKVSMRNFVADISSGFYFGCRLNFCYKYYRRHSLNPPNFYRKFHRFWHQYFISVFLS